MRIGINVDGVINNMSEFLQDYASKYMYEKGLSVSGNNYAYDTIDMFNWGIKNDSDFLSKYMRPYYTKIRPRRFASEVIRKMKKENNDIFIICSKQTFGITNDKEQFKEWLNKNHIVYNRFVYDDIDNLINWAENSLDIIVDDRPEVVQRLAFKIPVICFNNAYNNNIKGKNIYRAYGWYDIYSKIHKLNTLFE